MTRSHQIENTCKEIESINMSQMEILEVKSTITKVKNSLKDLNSSFKLGESKIN